MSFIQTFNQKITMKALYGVLIVSALAGFALFMPSCAYPNYDSGWASTGYRSLYDETPYYGRTYGAPPHLSY
jgi:hypothetical protein